MKFLTIVGARPEFIQIAPVDREIRKNHDQTLVHTGQHYDNAMSEVFFQELGVHKPEYNLGVGSDSHASQTGSIMVNLEYIMIKVRPEFVITISDTNSTMAAALTAVKLNLPVAHIEAGLRSYDRRMPEEINRIVTDSVSDVLFAPTSIAIENLKREGLTSGAINVGDVRVDIVHDLRETASKKLPHLHKVLGLDSDEEFALATIHRAGNTDNEVRLKAIIQALALVDVPVVIPTHPRLVKMMSAYKLRFSDNILATNPISFLDTLALLDKCQFLITDSGGLQKEAYMYRKQTITLRESTEWVETVTSGWNRLTEPEPKSFQAAIEDARRMPPDEHPNYYGTYGVSERIVQVLEAVEVQKGPPSKVKFHHTF